MMIVQDDVIIFAETDYRVSPTWQTSEGLSSPSEPASSTRVRAEPTTAENPASITVEGQ